MRLLADSASGFLISRDATPAVAIPIGRPVADDLRGVHTIDQEYIMEMKVENKGSDQEPEITEQPEEQESKSAKGAGGAAGANLSAASFTTYYTWTANGVHPKVPFANANVKANSRVFVNISEYSTDAQHRFIGAARMAVYNIAPYDGGFLAWVDISWGSPLHVRFDVFVDP
jgi:hypothetical protein